MVSFETYPCNQYYQQTVCEMNGDPRYVGGILDGDQEIPLSPAACFFYCCGAGVKSALETIRRAKKDRSTGLLPFGSDHKPYISSSLLSGRLVAFRAEGIDLQNGDVVIRSSGETTKLTNVFQYKPPK